MSKEELREINVSKYAQIGTAGDTQIGTDIDSNRTRNVWRLVASGTDDVYIYSGDSSDNERELIMKYTAPFSIGSDIENPVLTIRPNISSDGSVTNNQIYAKAGGTVDLTVDYYDE